ncbi:MAG: tetratricopeptide repeat protein [Vicinamibacterales bacterium]
MIRVAKTVTLALLALLVSVASTSAQGNRRILVMPFENVSRDARIVWVGEAASVLVADNLNALGASAITRDERREAFEHLQVPPAATLTDATMIRIGQLLRASEVVVGTLTMDGDAIVVSARAIALDEAKVRASTSERGALTDLFSLFEHVAMRVAPDSARVTAEVERPHPPVAAFENYIKGLLAETPATAVTYLQTALKADATFDRARIALWEVYDNQGEHAKALAAVRDVSASSALSRRARFRESVSLLNLKRYEESFTTLKALADARPTPSVLNNLGVVQLRRGGSPTTGVATYYFNRARETDETDPDYFFNLGYAYWLDRDPQASLYWLREALRRNPADGDAHYVLGAALAMAGHAAEAAREKELAHRLSSAYEDWDKRPANDAVPRGLERVKSDVELPHAREIEQTLASSQNDQGQLAAFYLDRARRLVEQERDADALAELNRVLFLVPYSPEAHLLVGRIHLRAGHAREAIDALNISVWSQDSAEAQAWLAQAHVLAKDVPAARAAAERALLLDQTNEQARRILAALPAR